MHRKPLCLPGAFAATLAMGTVALLAVGNRTIGAPAAAPGTPTDPHDPIATIDTNLGTIKIELFAKQAPQTVQNFIGLATGTKGHTDLKTGTMTKTPFFNGLTFHRVIPHFMIQGGDPAGNGTGGPGYNIKDEIVPGLNFNMAGRLAMANTGAPNSGGSQFFITTDPYPQLNGGYTIFGQVLSGQSVVREISDVARDPANDRPLRPVVIEGVTIQNP